MSGDERKGTNFKQVFDRCKQPVDYTVFVSTWLKELFIDQGLSN